MMKHERAVPTNPEKMNPRLVAAAESLLVLSPLNLLGGPREARGRLAAPGALRRRPPSAAAALRAAGPRFARPS